MESKFIKNIFNEIKESNHKLGPEFIKELNKIQREANKSFVYLLAGKSYGSLVEAQVRDFDDSFVPPSKKVDPDYIRAAYDMFILDNNLKVEIKGVRASRKEEGGVKTPFIDKAMKISETGNFWANFQQLKPSLTDVFIFVLDWLDKREFFLIPSSDINVSIPGFKKGQHRGNVGEYQVWMIRDNYDYFNKYKLSKTELIKKLKEYKK